MAGRIYRWRVRRRRAGAGDVHPARAEGLRVEPAPRQRGALAGRERALLRARGRAGDQARWHLERAERRGGAVGGGSRRLRCRWRAGGVSGLAGVSGEFA